MGKLFKYYGFSAYIIVVFLNAFTDLGHKIIIQNTVFKVYDGNEQIILTAIVNALILLPFILLFSPSGFISDKFEKHKVMRISAIVAVILTLLITLSYYLGYFWLSFFLTFALATQSAVYSPAKYGYIKELLGNENLAAANGVVQATTIVAILGGIFFYSIGFEFLLEAKDIYLSGATLQEIAPLGWFLVLSSLIELYFAYKMPNKSKNLSKKSFDKKKYLKGSYLKNNMKLIKTQKIIWLSIVGLSVFWALSQVLLAIFPSYVKEYMNETNAVVVQGLMALSGIGIIIGSALASKLSKNYIETGIIPLAALGIFISVSAITFIDTLYLNGLVFFLFGLFGGLLIVPLNSLIQFNSSNKRLGLILAGNNFIQNVFMFSFLLATIFVSLWHIDVVYIFYLLSVVALIGAIYTIRMLPQSLVKFLILSFISIRYKLSVQGLDNIPQNKGVLLLGNHISWLDWAMVQMAMPRQVRFVMERSIYEKKFLKGFLDFFGVIPISTFGGKGSLQKVSEYLNKGDIVCLFPEGTISRNGHLNEFKKGYELAAKDSNAVIVPFYIGGLWGTKFSRSNINFAEDKKTKRSQDVIVSFGEKLDINTKAEKLKAKIFELSIDSWDRYIDTQESIDRLWLKSAKRMGKDIAIVDSMSGDKFSYYKSLTLSILFSKLIKKQKEDTIGLLMPTTSIGAILNLSTIISGKTVVNINYTSSSEAIIASIKQAKIKTIYSSSKFIKKLKDKGIDIYEILDGLAQIIILEELKKDISKITFIRLYLASRFLPSFILKNLYFRKNNLSSRATILFSSGSEGLPKGVVLSHKNIIANTKQVTDILNPNEKEVFLGSLPMFHAFGLTVTTFLPLLEGFKLVCHPDPTDAYGVGKAVVSNNATFMCATATFLRLYTKNKKVNPLMFESLRYVISGAEKLSPSVREEFKQKFSKVIYEGYGATECAPVISCNIPDCIDTRYWTVQVGAKVGSIGMAIPGCALRVIDPDTLAEVEVGQDGLLIVSGPNVMQEYLDNAQKTAEVIFEHEGRRWYKTGDKGRIDKDGFITIVDRYSRFAKIAGEMVSLSAVEAFLQKILLEDDVKIICTNIPDDKKGEKIVLLIDKDLENLKDKIIKSGINPLWIPSNIMFVDDMPILGSGKIDIKRAKTIALENYS